MIILLEAFKIEGERSTDHFHFCRIAASFNKRKHVELGMLSPFRVPQKSRQHAQSSVAGVKVSIGMFP